MDIDLLVPECVALYNLNHMWKVLKSACTWYIQFVLHVLWYEQLTHLMKKCDVFKKRQKSENHTALMLICLWTCKSQICFLSTWTIGFLFYNNKGLCFHRNFQVLAALDSLMELRLWDFFRDSENDLICPDERTSEITESRQNPSQNRIL